MYFATFILNTQEVLLEFEWCNNDDKSKSFDVSLTHPDASCIVRVNGGDKKAISRLLGYLTDEVPELLNKSCKSKRNLLDDIVNTVSMAYKKLFKRVVMMKKIISLTNISDGTLLVCCRETKIFKNIKADGKTLNWIRGKWREFVKINIDNYTFYTWVDSWRAFIKKAEQA